MIAPHKFKNEKVDRLVERLTRSATQMSRLVGKLPTTDIQVLAKLDQLSAEISRLVAEEPGRERGSMLLDQARRQALFQRDRYLQKARSGQLRH